MRLNGAWIWIAIGVSTVACGKVSKEADSPRDARSADGPADGLPLSDAKSPRCNPTAPFSSPVAATALNTPSFDEGARLSPDELTVYFSSNRPGGAGDWDLWTATRNTTSDAFGPPSLVAGVNTGGRERRPTVTADGLTLYAFVGNSPNYDLASATRADTASSFTALSPVAALNTNVNDETPYVLPNGTAIYFDSNRGNTYQLYRAARTGTGFDAPALVTGTNLDIGNQADLAISSDEMKLYFSSDRNGGGTTRVYEATRASLALGFDASGRPQS